MLSLEGVSVNIGPTQILRDVSMEIPPGTMCGLIGRNGVGKTTLMRTLMGARKPVSGSMRFDGVDLVKVSVHLRARLGIGYMPEDRRLVPDLTAEENILLPVWATGVADSEARLKRIYELMPEVKAFRDRGATQLSGGQQKFVAFARALMVGTKILLLDEPGEGIAPVLAQRMVEIMADLKDAGESVLIAESNDTHIGRLLDRTFVIERGSILKG